MSLPSPHCICKVASASCREEIRETFTIRAPSLQFSMTGVAQMNPHISLPRQHGGTPSFGGTPPASRSEGVRMPRFFKRCVWMRCSGGFRIRARRSDRGKAMYMAFYDGKEGGGRNDEREDGERVENKEERALTPHGRLPPSDYSNSPKWISRWPYGR